MKANIKKILDHLAPNKLKSIKSNKRIHIIKTNSRIKNQ